jgi:ribose 1,5-bisphosphokinase
VGNSGAGKDSIISGVIANYPSTLKKIYSPRRYITREASDTEKNIHVSPEEFEELDKKGEFALKWHIYGLDYGIPVKMHTLLKKGHPVIINVSRTIVKKAKKKYKNLKVIFISVPLEITIKRLKDRGREDGEYLAERIQRAKIHQKFSEADAVINNSGDLDNAISKCLDYIIKTVKSNKK